MPSPTPNRTAEELAESCMNRHGTPMRFEDVISVIESSTRQAFKQAAATARRIADDTFDEGQEKLGKKISVAILALTKEQADE